jgi:hypothetical protein
MANPMYPIILEEMARNLKISKRDLESDIKHIAEYWETTLIKIPVDDMDVAIFLLTTFVDCYLWGRGVDVRLKRTSDWHRAILTSLVTLIALYALKQPESRYPKIHVLVPLDKAIVDNSYRSWDILSEVEKILKEKG